MAFTLGNGLACHQVVVGALQNNAYLLTDDNGNTLLIDAADDASSLLEMVDGRAVSDIVTTHRHHDHIGALAEMVARTGATPWCGSPDAEAIEQATGIQSRGLWTGDHIMLGAQRIDVIGLVGHTPGSITLVVRADTGPTHLFTGDCLFPGGVGKTSTSKDFTALMDDVTRELFDAFPDDTLVHPGHGSPTRLGAERPHLAEWRARGW